MTINGIYLRCGLTFANYLNGSVSRFQNPVRTNALREHCSFLEPGLDCGIIYKAPLFLSVLRLRVCEAIGQFTYLLFAICGLSALLVAVGLLYRTAIIGLFLSFTYIELIDKSTYLNHYYFTSMVCLLLIFLPAHAYFSVDAYRQRSTLPADRIPAWCIDSLKLFVALLYIFAGLAKLNSDWLLHALPLRIWLPAHNDLPLVGSCSITDGFRLYSAGSGACMI